MGAWPVTVAVPWCFGTVIPGDVIADEKEAVWMNGPRLRRQVGCGGWQSRHAAGPRGQPQGRPGISKLHPWSGCACDVGKASSLHLSFSRSGWDIAVARDPRMGWIIAPCTHQPQLPFFYS
jgi:hypothetical protein